MIEYKEFEDRIRNCQSEKELLVLEDEVSELAKKYPDIDSDRLYLLIAYRRRHLQDHVCDPWKLRK